MKHKAGWYVERWVFLIASWIFIVWMAQLWSVDHWGDILLEDHWSANSLKYEEFVNSFHQCEEEQPITDELLFTTQSYSGPGAQDTWSALMRHCLWAFHSWKTPCWFGADFRKTPKQKLGLMKQLAKNHNSKTKSDRYSDLINTIDQVLPTLSWNQKPAENTVSQKYCVELSDKFINYTYENWNRWKDYEVGVDGKPMYGSFYFNVNELWMSENDPDVWTPRFWSKSVAEYWAEIWYPNKNAYLNKMVSDKEFRLQQSEGYFNWKKWWNINQWVTNKASTWAEQQYYFNQPLEEDEWVEYSTFNAPQPVNSSVVSERKKSSKTYENSYKSKWSKKVQSALNKYFSR